MKKTVMPALAFVVATWAVGAHAQSTTGQSGSEQGQSGTTIQGHGQAGQSTTGTQGGVRTPTAPPTGQEPAGNPDMPRMRDANSEPQKFVQKAAELNIAEIEFSRLAAERAQDAQVKQFAQKMVDEHTKAGDKLKSISNASGLTFPASLNDKFADKREKLSERSGADFDKEYMKLMVSAHEDTEDLLEDRVEDQPAPGSSARVDMTAGASGSSGHVEKPHESGQSATSGTSQSGSSATQSGTSASGQSASGQSGSSTDPQSGRSGEASAAGTSGMSPAPESPGTIDSWAAETLPKVQMHLEEARKIEKRLKDDANRSNDSANPNRR